MSGALWFFPHYWRVSHVYAGVLILAAFALHLLFVAFNTCSCLSWLQLHLTWGWIGSCHKHHCFCKRFWTFIRVKVFIKDFEHLYDSRRQNVPTFEILINLSLYICNAIKTLIELWLSLDVPIYKHTLHFLLNGEVWDCIYSWKINSHHTLPYN